jgi:hypothetical protein
MQSPRGLHIIYNTLKGGIVFSNHELYNIFKFLPKIANPEKKMFAL